jgi:arylformamidase
MARIIDISLPISEKLLVWPGDPPIEVEPSSRIAQGDAANVSRIRMGTHTGTHIDPPFHFLDDGRTVDNLPFDALVGEALVADLQDIPGNIGSDELEALGIERGTERLLLKTANSSMWESVPHEFPDEYVNVTPDGAAWIAERGIRLVGIDFLGIEARGAEGHPTHVTLLGSRVVIVEGLDLAHVDPGKYQFVCLPLRIAGGDGAPARAILIES